MIALDTSPIVALIRHEPDAEQISARMSKASQISIGRPTELELHLVTAGKIGEAAARAAIDRILLGVQSFVIDEAHLAAAMTAFDRFGKGRHPASLNYVDCMAYAIAKALGCPLLYKGEDFARTDMRSAL